MSMAFYLLVFTKGRLYRSANVVSAGYSKFCYPLSFNALVRGGPLRIYGKALRFLKLVLQAAEGEDLVIVACTVFD